MVNRRTKRCEYLEVQLAIDRKMGPQVTNKTVEVIKERQTTREKHSNEPTNKALSVKWGSCVKGPMGGAGWESVE